MKKILFLSALVLFSTIVWLSCQKGGVVSNKQIPTADPLSTIDIGAWHNTVLNALAAENNTGQTSSTVKNTESYSDLQERIIKILVKKDPSIFVESDIMSQAAMFDKISIDAQMRLPLKPGETFDKFGIITNYLASNKIISASLSVEFEKIHTLTTQGTDGATVLKAVNDLKLQKFPNSDQKYLNAFVSVYNSSYSFWHNRTNSATKTTQGLQTDVAESPCGDAVILADAAGAAYGLILSPLWSIIEGAIFSTIADNSDVCNNGKSA